jgi:hypothetical protein
MNFNFHFPNFLDRVSPFWQGVLASLLAGIILAIASKLYGTYSRRARDARMRRQKRLEILIGDVRSPDSVTRVEAYFQIVFTLLEFLFLASIFWVLSIVLSVFFPSLPH